MKRDVLVPSVGESITSGVLAAWLKNNGDTVNEGDPLFELETDKATVEVPSPGTGVLEILVEAGTEVEIEQQVASLKDQGAAQPAPAAAATENAAPEQPEPQPEPKEKKPEEEKTPEEKPEEKPDTEPETKPETKPEKPAKPAVEEPGPDAASPEPAPPGPGGRQTRTRMSLVRRKTAERLTEARRNAAYLTTFNEIDMEKVIEIRAHYRDQFEKEHGIKIGFTSFFVKACCSALKTYPEVNAYVDGDEIIYNHYYDIGIAVSTDNGLIVPVIRNADTLSFAGIETAVSSLARSARDKAIMPDDLMGGTFTITNGGVFGSLLSTPLPAYPQTAILGMHTIKKRAVVIDDQIVARPMMYVALTYDHRVIDGREAVGFLSKIKEFIEDPDKLLLEM